jgi:hypothetical protein
MPVAADGIDGTHNAVERDRVIYNALGFLGGCLIAIVFFRRVSFMIIAAAPPLLAILLSLGALGWFDFQLNMFLNMMTPPLVMVISSSDSKQLTFAARDRLIAGDSKAISCAAPTLRLLGWLSALAILVALIADLFILQPVVTLLFRDIQRYIGCLVKDRSDDFV